MVDTVDVVAQKFKNPTDRVSLDCAAQMTNMHVFSDVRWTEVNQNALFLLAFFLLQRHVFSSVDVFYLLLHEAILQCDVKEKSAFGRIAFANLSKINFFNCVISLLVYVSKYGVRHVLTRREAERALFFELVEEFHRWRTDIVPLFVLFLLHCYGLCETRHRLLGCTSYNVLQMSWYWNHYSIYNW